MHTFIKYLMIVRTVGVEMHMRVCTCVCMFIQYISAYVPMFVYYLIHVGVVAHACMYMYVCLYNTSVYWIRDIGVRLHVVPIRKHIFV